ncbi:hypothetical protein F4820DRAFT_402808 [Hypoxylon rubiginosum]|uniref:Uncharacterized protein n=1 Tax=Hypoxylon rubiginosum TaxID=110542 RepID=A0ACB9ZGI1_9PEZI|nr:hypothetical protein F4820DRAFT_402808 [Hypoxylon rubiginosum]
MDSLSSSPDPLGDDPPSSALSYARRTTNHTLTNHDLSAISIPRSQLTRTTSPLRHSPRKRIFELDVGNELSPQKILVTVEAEEAMKRGINRRLFPSSSPTRSDRRVETTTTTIPLNDEIENESTPRRRGRPRRTSNGTPMPRGKKRAGTPLQNTTRQTRRKSGPESDASVFNDTPVQANVGSSLSKPKARPRKTPKNASKAQAVPSSQLSNNGAKRKRGRPRKALMPDDFAILADGGNQSAGGDVANDDTIQPVQEHPEDLLPPVPDQDSDVFGGEGGRHEEAYDDTQNLIDEIARESDGTPVPEDISRAAGGIQQDSGSRTLSHRQESDEEDVAMDEDYPEMMEPQSDAESDFTDIGAMPRSGQDTLAHASDFSMIAVESLPSFQANRSAFPSDPPEMGEETSHIINQTLESLRRSTQTEADGDDQHDAPGGSLAEIGDNSLLGRLRSPRRQKEVPLSRQVFSGKTPHVDDSFSSIPESILHAATPGRLPMKTASTNQHDDSNVYDDSFSEIPEAILEAATPRPRTRTVGPTEESYTQAPAQVSPVNRNTGPDFGSSRLPTPDDTSSSNAGSKRAPEDELDPSSRAQTIAGSHPNSDIQSSPPIMNRPRAMDFGPSQLDQEISNTPALQRSSPRLPHSTQEHAEPPKSLEPPFISRPSLSPIVRVGRTLQNVMSDRSSPEGRESSLGSPFRGSMGNDHPQPVTSDRSNDSPTRANHSIRTQSNAPYWLNSRPALAQSTRSSFSHNQPPAQGDVIGDIGGMSDPFGPDVSDYSEAEALRRSAYDADSRVSQPRPPVYIPSVTSSTRAMLPSDNAMSWVADADDQQDGNQQDGLETMRSRTSTVFATRGSNMSQVMATNDEAVDHKMEDEQEQFNEDFGELPEEQVDDADLWDMEASRLTPKRPERARTAPQRDEPPPRRTKIPSPWRRTSRRLIYREEIASPSQIAIEESLQSEAEEAEAASIARPIARQRRPRQEVQSKAQGKRPESAVVNEPSPAQPEHQASEPEPEIREQPIEPIDASEYSMLLEQDEATPISQEKPADVSDYSMLAQRTQNAPATQEKPASVKSRLLSGFNLMSFFSSPASLPKKLPEAEQADASDKTRKIAQPVFQKPTSKEPEMAQPREPQRSLWSTGLFPSIPQKEFQPSPERRTDLFSPAPALASNNTVPDTYESASPSPAPSPSPSPSPSPDLSASPTPSESPEPDSPEPNSPQSPQSPPPSTPERQTYPPIEQKQNFTPRPGQASGYLFRRGPSATRSDAETDLLQLPSDDQQESSLMTDGTDYERLPPREKPSRWDKTLSPSKSCFRSPLKPTTPGRVVAFTNIALSPTAQAQARAEEQNSLRDGGSGLFSQGLPLQSITETRETETRASASYSRRPLRNIAPAPASIPAPIPAPVHAPRTNNPSAATTINKNAFLTNNSNSANYSAPPQPPPQPRAFALSPTEWTRQHWVRMDELLYLRRHEPLQFQQLVPLPPRSQRPSLTAGLLGKEVAAQGESIILEPWHLDIIDAFRHEVGGWDMRSLAKRLFALIIGEERRRVAKETKHREMEMQTQREREREMAWRAGRTTGAAGFWGGGSAG